jgi:hypothetical protein
MKKRSYITLSMKRGEPFVTLNVLLEARLAVAVEPNQKTKSWNI